MIDKTKKYKTRDGQDVVIYATDAPDPVYSVHGRVGEMQMSWTAEGKFTANSSHRLDLVEFPQLITKWVTFYKQNEQIYSFTDDTHECRHKILGKKIACVPVTFVEGEGL